MKTMELKIVESKEGLYFAEAEIGDLGIISTKHYKTPQAAKRSFCYVCKRLGISHDMFALRDGWVFRY